MKGAYIVLEGTVGTGKSTQAKKLYAFLKEKFPENEIILTREPGGDEIAEKIREVAQGTDFSSEMAPECEAYLYAAARAQSLRKAVFPVLEKGGIVISDRSFVSSLAYQGIARGLGIKKVFEINREAVGDIMPDIILFIDLDPETGLKRSFDKKGDKFEREDTGFFKKIREGYMEIAKMPEFKEIWVNIDGNGSPEEVFSRIKEAMDFLRHS